jgi:hypothetical protein
MSDKRFAGLTIEQLNAAGAAAGADAVSKAHATGLAAPGMTNLRLASGDELKVLTRLHPDGTLEIVDDRICFFSVNDFKNDAAHTTKTRRQRVILERPFQANDDYLNQKTSSTIAKRLRLKKKSA